MANLINNLDNFLGKIIFNSFSSLRYCIFNSVIYHANLKKKLRENTIISNFNNRKENDYFINFTYYSNFFFFGIHNINFDLIDSYSNLFFFFNIK